MLAVQRSTILGAGLAITLALSLPAAEPSAIAPQEQPGKAPDGVSALLEWIAREYLPKEFEDDRHWGKEAKVWAGVRISWDDDGLHTRRKWDSVRQGTWYRYKATLLDSERRLHLQIGQLRELPKGRAGFEVAVKARMAATGRMSQWQRNVQILSVGVEAQADIELRLQCSTAFQFDAKKFPPDVLLDVRVDDADIRLVDFRLEKFGLLEDGAARLLGRSLREMIEDRLAKAGDKLATNMNAKLENKKPRLPLSELAGSGWDSWVKQGPADELEPTKK